MGSEPWTGLLSTAGDLLSELPENLRKGLSVGGGSMLANLLHHRISQDLDFFHHDAQAIGLLSPRLNPNIERMRLPYQEASNFLKFHLGEQEIDLVIALSVSKTPTLGCLAIGSTLLVPRETPVEIMAKKILYRGSEATARDLYDLAAVHARIPGCLPKVAEAVGQRAIQALARRVERLGTRLPHLLQEGVRPTEDWRGFCHDVPRLLPAALAVLQGSATCASSAPQPLKGPEPR